MKKYQNALTVKKECTRLKKGFIKQVDVYETIRRVIFINFFKLQFVMIRN